MAANKVITRHLDGSVTLTADLWVEVIEGCNFLLSFVPAWAKDVPEGLDPTFYGTLTAEGDRLIKARTDAVRATLEGLNKEGVT